MLDHPLPWRIQRDWSYEVTASDGHIIAKCQQQEEAMEIVGLSEKINKEIINSIDDWPNLGSN